MPKSIAKRALQTILRALYVGPSRSVRVLEYHYVDETGSSLSVSPTQLRQHLELFRREGFTTLSADEFTDRAMCGRCGSRELFLTFDDGFENFHTFAAPLLAEFRMRATVFIVTDLVGKPPRWLTEDRPAIERFMSQFNLSAADKRRYDRSMESFSTCKLMTWEQIEHVRSLGMDVQSHTARHPFLTQLSDDRLAEELSVSLRTLKETLGIESRLICYPYGDCDDRVIAAAREAGYRAGFLSGRLNFEADPFRIGRVPIGGPIGMGEVSFRLTRAYEQFWKLRGGVRKMSR